MPNRDEQRPDMHDGNTIYESDRNPQGKDNGNFLTETYISLRRLENEALRAMSNGQGEFGGEFSKVRVSIRQFHGIEINDFAVSVAVWRSCLKSIKNSRMRANKVLQSCA